jgi:small subunit ribosomal protein S3
MGQKVNPIGLRLGINRDWDSSWLPTRKVSPEFIKEDYEIRKYIKKTLFNAGISKINIARIIKSKVVRITIHAARPGLVIGKKGEDIDKLKKALMKITKKDVKLLIEEVKQPNASAQLAAENVATQLERRVAFRRAMKKMMQNAMKTSEVKGIKVAVSGRLGGAEMARTEWYIEGRVPLHTFRAKIDYGFAEAHTTYGVIGVKVWFFKKEILKREIVSGGSTHRKRRASRRRRGGNN